MSEKLHKYISLSALALIFFAPHPHSTRSTTVRDIEFTRERLHQERAAWEHQYTTNMLHANTIFSNVCQQGRLPHAMQQSLYTSLHQAWIAHEQYFNFCKTGGVQISTNLPWSERMSNQHLLLQRNLYGLDGKPPTLERHLRSNGVNIKVEPIFTLAESNTLHRAIVRGFYSISILTKGK